MKIRLTQPGFEKYTGQMGVMQFEDGVTTHDVSHMDAMRMGAVMSCEAVDGQVISPSQVILDANQNAAVVLEERVADTTEVAEAPVAQPVEAIYTQEQLEQIASEKGISGLREIAEPIGIRARSVEALIEALVKSGMASKSIAG
jgi:hypothetical protein